MPARPGAGRPSSYTAELTDRICNELIEGKSLIKICEADDMPHRCTVIRWLGEHPEFATKYARAREAQADVMDDLILDVASKSTAETAQSDRVKIGAYQWRAAKLQPKKYGDRLDLNHSGYIDTMDEKAVDARLAELLGKAGIAALDREEGADPEAGEPSEV